MPENVIVWHIDTVPDLEGYAVAADLQDKAESEIRDGMGDKFPKPIFHKIICIGALIASRSAEAWQIEAIGAPHIGARTEKELIQDSSTKLRSSKAGWLASNV